MKKTTRQRRLTTIWFPEGLYQEMQKFVENHKDDYPTLRSLVTAAGEWLLKSYGE